MKLLHSIKSFFIDDIEVKENVANLLAVSAYADSIIRPKEIKQSYVLLENLFNGEDYDYLKDEIDILLDEFQENPASYIKSREKAIKFVKDNKAIRKELIEIVKLVFRSDYEFNRKEQELLSNLESNNKIGE